MTNLIDSVIKLEWMIGQNRIEAENAFGTYRIELDSGGKKFLARFTPFDTSFGPGYADLVDALKVCEQHSFDLEFPQISTQEVSIPTSPTIESPGEFNLSRALDELEKETIEKQKKKMGK